jgi:hypothetical protein
VPIPLQWDGQPGPAHVDTVETANRLYNFLPQALHRIQGAAGAPPALQAATLAPLAMGGGMAVYKITALLQSQQTQHLVCKIPHQRRIVYTAATDHQTTAETTRQLLDRLVALADHLTQRTPGLFPRSGGVWHWHDAEGTPHHLLVEEFIPGLSVERLKHHYEQQWMDNQLSADLYHQHRTAVERLAVATFVRLWDALDRRLFTSDPSPWNVLVHQADARLGQQPVATIIDLHGLEDNVGLTYVVQRLAAVYGLRQDTLADVLIPGVLDALGVAAGIALLRAQLSQLEAEAERTRHNLGADVQQPLVQLIRTLA